MLGADSRRVDSASVEFEKEVLLGHTAQDVASALGAPNRVFYKSEDKMRIHSPNAHRRVMATRSDYFFNYFSLGLVYESNRIHLYSFDTHLFIYLRMFCSMLGLIW